VPVGVNAKHISPVLKFQLGAVAAVTPEPPDEPEPPAPTTSVTTQVHGELVETFQDGKRVRVMLLLTPNG
jgi:hypothetical protein